MPRYFFHTEGKYAHIDEEGTELADASAARAEAMRTTGEMLRDASFRSRAEDLCSGNPWRLWVTDGPGGSGRTHVSIHVLVQDGPPEDVELQAPAQRDAIKQLFAHSQR